MGTVTERLAIRADRRVSTPIEQGESGSKRPDSNPGAFVWPKCSDRLPCEHAHPSLLPVHFAQCPARAHHMHCVTVNLTPHRVHARCCRFRRLRRARLLSRCRITSRCSRSTASCRYASPLPARATLAHASCACQNAPTLVGMCIPMSMCRAGVRTNLQLLQRRSQARKPAPDALPVSVRARPSAAARCRSRRRRRCRSCASAVHQRHVIGGVKV